MRQQWDCAAPLVIISQVVVVVVVADHNNNPTAQSHREQVWFFLNQTRIQSLWNTWEQQGSRRMIPSPPASSARHTAQISSSQLPPSHSSDFSIRTLLSDSPMGPPKPPLSSSKYTVLNRQRHVRMLKSEEWEGGSCEKEICAVCLAELAGGEGIIRMEPCCSHVFHKDCIFVWLMKNQTCPLCRRVVVVVGNNNNNLGDDDERSNAVPLLPHLLYGRSP
ncbi:unnamed protein product [Cuscuta campestris]|uniref:RING-type E3 ubiquitin transferase n=1 Tax=Cuscuta campestris TaxID=132261 RepID=A0A484L069_9ASTE|nr:unnamed protein product [Cuscuta campestris]